MPRVHTQKAKADIYACGAQVPANTKSGFKRDRSKPFDDNDKVIIPKGATYYKWTFRHGGTRRSLTRPKPSQLTQSPFLQTVYGWDENPIECNEDSTAQEVQAAIDERVSEIEELRDETQGSLENMPDSLQYGPTGELLQERIDALEGMITDLEGIYIDEDSFDFEEVMGELENITYEGG